MEEENFQKTETRDMRSNRIKALFFSGGLARETPGFARSTRVGKKYPSCRRPPRTQRNAEELPQKSSSGYRRIPSRDKLGDRPAGLFEFQRL